MQLYELLKKKNKLTRFGLVLNWKFHSQRCWVSALSYYLVEEILKEFNPVIIPSQFEYEVLKEKLDVIICLEPGWAAPVINFDKNRKCLKMVFLSDPHSKTEWFEDYFQKNNFDYLLSYYNSPFFYHFPEFPKEKFVHLAWAIPDHFVKEIDIKTPLTNEVIIFGGKDSDAYDVRNYCRSHPEVINFNNSGVENKVLSDEEYFEWLSGFGATIAAGSSNPIYELVTPKYFEIAFSGPLLIGQYCPDLMKLGFDESNMLIFTKNNFEQILKEYKLDPSRFVEIRRRARELILDQHMLSHRIDVIRNLIHLHNQNSCK